VYSNATFLEKLFLVFNSDTIYRYNSILDLYFALLAFFTASGEVVCCGQKEYLRVTARPQEFSFYPDLTILSLCCSSFVVIVLNG